MKWGGAEHRIKNESGYRNQVGLLRRRCQLATILGSTFSPADKAPPSTPRKIVTHKNHRWDFSPLSTGRPNRINTDRLQINRGVLGAVEPGWAVVRRLAAPGGPSMVPRVMPCAAVLPSASADALIAECGGGQPKVYRMDNTLLRADFLGLVPRGEKSMSSDPPPSSRGYEAVWGARIVGYDTGDGWVRLATTHARLYLPTHMGDVLILPEWTELALGVSSAGTPGVSSAGTPCVASPGRDTAPQAEMPSTCPPPIGLAGRARPSRPEWQGQEQ